MPYEQPLVCVITLSYNQNKYTIPCINSILQSEYNNYKIILVDNGSSKDNFTELKNEIEKIGDEKINLERIEQNKGYVRGINYGISLAKAYNPKYFAIMNNDTIIDRFALSSLVNVCKEFNNKAIVSGKVYEYDNKNCIQYIGGIKKKATRLEFRFIGTGEIDEGKYDKVAEMDMIDDILWLMPSIIIDEIGLYSQYYWFNYEQADYALRAKKRGYKLIYTPQSKLWHKGSVAIGGKLNNPYKMYWSAQSGLIYRFQHATKYEFLKSYFKIFLSGLWGVIKSLASAKNEKKNKFLLGYAKIRAFLYFHKWIILRNENEGFNPISKYI